MKKLTSSQLSPQIEASQIEASLNAPVVDPVHFIGQKRACSALDFGLGMNFPGYNIYVMGEAALGRYTLVKDKLDKASEQKETPFEWLYVNNFENHREPSLIRMFPGEGKSFIEDIDSLIDEILDTFPAAFDNPGYQRKKKAIDRTFNRLYDEAMTTVEQAAMRHNVMLYEENGVVSFAPLVEGKPLDDIGELSDEDRQAYYELIAQLEGLLNETLIELPKWKRQSSENLRKLKRETSEQAIKPLLKELERKYSSHIGILKYLKELRTELIDAVLDWLADEADDSNKEEVDKHALMTEFFSPNLLVSFKEEQNAPVVYEANPTFSNVFGKVEYNAQQGTIHTSYRSIQPGALHKANGGFLVMDAEKLMAQPQVWDALKLSLKTHEIKTDLGNQDSNAGGAISLKPQLVPLDVKILLLGSRDLFYLMQEYDEEFNEQFRVLADFEYSLPSSDKYRHQFNTKVKNYCDESLNKSISTEAVCGLLNFSHRQASHQKKLSARFADVLELVNEANYFASQDTSEVIEYPHVDEALKAKQYRSGQISEQMMAEIREGHILIDTQGEHVGKINGLTVLEIGDTTFGTPARITATVYAGSDGVLDIEREAELGKAIHSKGVMLLTGYLGNKYAQEFNLTLSANIAIEQSYGYIDGDSASLAELCALISAITNLPVDQGLALTGSINQHGEVQAIGGVNEKIEGFFKLCNERGLNGQQGVIIPESNAVNLVLNEQVRDAVERERFHIYTVSTVDQALELLMKHSPGEVDSKGQFPIESINYRALERLRHIADIVNGQDHEDSEEEGS